ncbi:MAG: hypothetical protein K2I63_01580 [Helicobacter sp.]|nr:hypothetical protein [Helicobacter sp.]
MKTTTEIIAKEGWKPLIINFIILLISWLLSCDLISFIAFISFLVLIYCYYNPERIPQDVSRNTILSPIDGEIKNIETTDDGIYLEVYKSFFSHGLLRMPFAGIMNQKSSVHGLLNASPLLGERISLEFFHKDSIANVEAILYPKFFPKSLQLYFDKTNFLMAERIGFFLNGEAKIKIPLNTKLQVCIGDKLLAGSSILGFIVNEN